MSVIEWIIDNKEWLFSGVGVVILGWLLSLLVHRKNKGGIKASNGSVAAKSIKGSQIITGDNNKTKR